MATNRPNDPLLRRERPTDEQLAAESVITEADIQAAISSFNTHAPPTARGLLEAVPEGDKGKKP